MSSKKDLPVLSVILFAFAGLMGLYSICAAIDAVKYVVESLTSGSIILDGNIFNIVRFMVESFGVYLVYATALFSLAVILQHSSTVSSLLLADDEFSDDNDDDKASDQTTEKKDDDSNYFSS